MISPHAKTSGISSQSWILDSTLWIPEGLVSDSLSVKPGFLIPIELFTDTAAISNLLDLRSIMGCPGGTRPVFTGAFRANRELHFIFHGEKAIIITSKHGTTIFFSTTIFFLETYRKIGPKSACKYSASILDRAHAPWASHNTP